MAELRAEKSAEGKEIVDHLKHYVVIFSESCMDFI